jgi:hypothetical protein
MLSRTPILGLAVLRVNDLIQAYSRSSNMRKAMHTVMTNSSPFVNPQRINLGLNTKSSLEILAVGSAAPRGLSRSMLRQRGLIANSPRVRAQCTDLGETCIEQWLPCSRNRGHLMSYKEHCMSTAKNSF